MSKPLSAAPLESPTPSSVDDVLALVRARGGRVTQPRRILLEVLFEARTHMGAEAIAHAVQERAPEVNMSTIYRNLEEFQELGVVIHSHLGHGPATYDLAALAHVHFVCEQCGTTVEAPAEMFQGLAHDARAKLGFTIDPRHFAILGLCRGCSDKAEHPA